VAFSAEVEVDAGRARFEVEGTFALDAHSDGISPADEPVSVSVGDVSLTIQKGSFKHTLIGAFTFEGVVDGRKVEASFVPGSVVGAYAFEIEVSGPDPTGGRSRVPVQLSIGNDGARAIAKVERE
jgi:hypothetical protein